MQLQKLVGLGHDIVCILAFAPDRLQFSLEAVQRGGEALRLRGGRRWQVNKQNLSHRGETSPPQSSFPVLENPVV